MISRSFLPAGDQETSNEFEVINAFKFLPMRQERIQKLQLETSKEETLQLLKATSLEGWPEDRSKVPPQLTLYDDMRDELGVYDGRT